MSSGARICLAPRLSGVGGMVSFQHKLAAGLAARGLQVSYDPDDPAVQAILLVGGTRRLSGLWRARRRGIPIIQRLDGMNWIHRLQGVRPSTWRHFLRAEYGNFLLARIRSRLATGVVYQSQFSRAWWERVYGDTPVPAMVVYNGVDLDQYSPQGEHQRPDDCCRVLLVEGSLMGGYETGLAAAVGLAEGLAAHLERVELMIVGRVADSIQTEWIVRTQVPIHWAGLAPREHIPEIDRSAHLLYSSDINAACPNSVVEALACGLPVVSFDTGALPELVAGDAGRIVSYGGDPWKLGPPDVPALVAAALEIYQHQERFRPEARARAQALFGLDRMVDGYLYALGIS